MHAQELEIDQPFSGNLKEDLSMLYNVTEDSESNIMHTCAHTLHWK